MTRGSWTGEEVGEVVKKNGSSASLSLLLPSTSALASAQSNLLLAPENFLMQLVCSRGCQKRPLDSNYYFQPPSIPRQHQATSPGKILLSPSPKYIENFRKQ